MSYVKETAWKPMGISRMLDYSFQFFRRHFVKLFLIMLIFYGPFYLLQQLLLPNVLSGNAFILQSFVEGLRDGVGLDSDVFESRMLEYEADATLLVGKLLVFFLIAILFLIFFVPVSITAVVMYVQSVLSGEGEPLIGDVLKRSFRRFWPVVGSNLLFGLILIGIFIGIMLAFSGISVLLALVVGAAANGPGVGGAIVMGVLIVAGLIGVLLAAAYFIIRLMYFLPLTALEGESIGLGRSWAMTRQSFWRLFWTMLVMYLIIYFITSILGMLFGFVLLLFAPPWVAQAVLLLANTVLAPLMIVLYAISFFDLRVRSEGLGLESLIRQTTGLEPTGAYYEPYGHQPYNGYNPSAPSSEAGDTLLAPDAKKDERE